MWKELKQKEIDILWEEVSVPPGGAFLGYFLGKGEEKCIPSPWMSYSQPLNWVISASLTFTLVLSDWTPDDMVIPQYLRLCKAHLSK